MKIKTILLMKMTTSTHPTPPTSPWQQRTQVPGRAPISIRRRTVLLGHFAQMTVCLGGHSHRNSKWKHGAQLEDQDREMVIGYSRKGDESRRIHDRF